MFKKQNVVNNIDMSSLTKMPVQKLTQNDTKTHTTP